jgi:hypothetical protein
VIPTSVRWLTNTCTLKERMPNGEIAASWVVFVTKRSKVVQSLVKKGIKEARV